jgi:hypothetical protein
MADQMAFIEDVTKNIDKAQEKYLGPTYPYHKQIRSPRGLHMNANGSFPQIARNIKGLVNYVEVLVTGTGPGSVTGRPLGNKFFLKTAGTCEDIKSKKVVDRYIYVNNIPQGNIPIISGAMGSNFSSFKGLIPGTMSNLNSLNPMGFIAAFGAGSQPKCRALSMETVDNNNARRRETRFVADIDIQQMNPCSWGGRGRNPVTKSRCRETFVDIDRDGVPLPKDPYVQMYLVLLSLGLIYIIYKLCIRKGKK